MKRLLLLLLLYLLVLMVTACQSYIENSIDKSNETECLQNDSLQSIDSLIEEPSEEDNPTVYFLAKKTHYAKDDSIFYEEEWEYNENGKVVKHISHTTNYTPIITLYEYDIKGNIIQEEMIYAFDKALIYMKKWEYTDEGYESGTVFYDKDGISARHSYERDEQGNLLYCKKHSVYDNTTEYLYYGENGRIMSDIVYYADDTVKCYSSYQYGDHGSYIHTNYNGDGSITSIEELTYDEQGNKLQVIIRKVDGTIILYRKGEYNEKGQLVSFIEKLETTIKRQGVIEYNEKGEMIKKSHLDINGDVKDYIIYEYDEDGNLIKEIFCDSTGFINSRYIYEYMPTTTESSIS